MHQQQPIPDKVQIPANLAAYVVSRQEYYGAQLQYKLPQKSLITVLKQLHFTQSLDVHIDSNVCLHFMWQCVHDSTLICNPIVLYCLALKSDAAAEISCCNTSRKFWSLFQMQTANNVIHMLVSLKMCK